MRQRNRTDQVAFTGPPRVTDPPPPIHAARAHLHTHTPPPTIRISSQKFYHMCVGGRTQRAI
jgi:hypothetical protein